MKKLPTAAGFIILPFVCMGQIQEPQTIIEKEKNGIIQSIEFSDQDKNYQIPESAEDFFKTYLVFTSGTQFRAVPQTSKRKEFRHEHYDQYYNGIKIVDAGYNFHYKNDKMYFAHGHYVKIDQLSTTPVVSPEKAKESFAKHNNIPLDSISGFISDLIIKEISYLQEKDTSATPKLVYKIYLFSNHKNNTKIGYIDAETGALLLTEPSLLDYSATGTFATRYNGSRQETTQNYAGAFHLADSTRGAIIHTWNLNGNTNLVNRIELSDNNNNWTSAEHSASENDMALDVQWALQKIYDHLNNSYGYNSFNDNGFGIDAK